eukprot:jgi/Astpho2/7894/Aster-x0333
MMSLKASSCLDDTRAAHIADSCLLKRVAVRLDVAYAGLVHQLGLSPGFFKEGWGDLAAIDFQDVQLFSQTWPPQHFDIIQPEWKVKWRSKKWNVECELLEASFK